MAKPTERDDEERISRSRESDTARAPRELLDLTDEERMQFLRDEFSYQALPTLPKLPGFHLCWLSTQNQHDSIMRRMRIGYQPVKADEMPQFKSLGLKTGEYEGCIAVNECILFKIPEEWYQSLMKTFHHDAPKEEEDKLKRLHDQMRSGEMSKGKPLIADVGDGTEELLRRDSRKGMFQ